AESTASSSKTNDMTFEHPLNVLRDQVELEVHQVIGARGVEIRSCSGLRDNPNRKALPGHIGHREADSVNGDRTFASDVLRKLGGSFDFEQMVSALFSKRHNARGALPGAFYKMT